MDEVLQRQIESLRKLKTKELKLRYRELFGEDSRSENHQHLFRRIAWRMQARAEGDLSERACQRAMELAQDVDLRLRAPRRFWSQLAARDASRGERDVRLPAIGTVLRRDYQGHMIEVTVQEDGFRYDGRIYGSLSAVAQAVTRTRWNGFLFFGLIRRAGQR